MLKNPDVKSVCQAPTSESDSVTSENNGQNVSERQTKILSAKSGQTLIKDSCLLTACMKTPIKSTNRLLQDASPSLNGRSPLKCLLNSPSRLDFNTTEKEANKLKGPSTTWATSHSLFLPETQRRHSKNVEWGTADDQNENREIVKSAKYSSPLSQENFSVEQSQTREDHWKSLGKRTGETCVEATTALPRPTSVTACFTPTQPLSTNAGKNSLSPLLGNSSGSKCASLSLKRNFRCSSGKSKSRRLFKLGEKWKVLSQQSVKKILFSDESPESFTGFDPQDIFKNCDNSDVSYETVSEVILTDPSEFEWVLGNCEGRRVTEGTHSDPSSCFYNPQRNVPLRDPAVADYSTLQERSHAQENGLKKYGKSQEDILVPFCGEDVKCLRKGMEHNFAAGGNCTRESVNSDSPKNYDDNIEIYLNAHRDFPPYIPNGQTVGYCSQPFQQNSHIAPNLIADSQHYPANDFETKVIQDLDYLQTPRYLHLGTIDTSISNYESGFDDRSVKHVYFSNSQHVQEFQYSDTTYPDLDVQAQDPLQNYSRLYNEATLEQSCSESLNQSLEKMQASTTPDQCSLPNYKENVSVFGNNGQSTKAILPQTPLPNLSYECSSLSVMSVERTLNESDQNLDTPPDPPIGSSNSNNNQNSNSFEAIPVLNFDSSFNLPVQNFPVLSDFAQPEYNEERDFLSGTALKDSEPRNFGDQSCYNTDKSMADDNIIADSINNENEIDESNISSHNKTEISFTDNIKCDNKIERNNISKTLAFYFNSYLTPPQDDKEYYSETVSTAETHSLISSLSQTAVAPLKKSQEHQQTSLECRPDLPSAAKLSAVSPELQTGHKPDFLTEPLLENEMPQLTLGCELQTPPSPQIDRSSSYQKVLEQRDDDLDMPPRLQIEVQQPPLFLDSQHQLAPPKLKPEVTLMSQQKLRHSASQLEQKQPDSSLLFSSSPTSSSLPSITEPALQNTDLAVHGEDDYIALSKFPSSFQDLDKINLAIPECSVCSCLTNNNSKTKSFGSTTASHPQHDTEASLISNTTSYNSTLDRKPQSVISSSSSLSLTSSDPHVHVGNGNSKSDSEVTDFSLKLPPEGMDTSDEAYAISDSNGLKNDSSTEVKDSGFFSVDELTPKKSPSSDLRCLSSNVKKLSSIARPCSVVLEKTPDTLLVHTMRFPLQKAVDQQNTFSVKRVDTNDASSPNSRAKPRLLKRLSDNQKTFRLDYIHGSSGGRKNLSRPLAKTRNSTRQNYKFK